MLLSDVDLKRFWKNSTSFVPIVIIGGGRWGRTWAIAISLARGYSVGVTIVARSDKKSTAKWAQEESSVAGVTVVGSLSEAMKQTYVPEAAIIASRPRDHVRDAIEAIHFGLDILVEKPISDNSNSGWELLNLARKHKTFIAVGTEYSFLPAFHLCAKELANQGVEDLKLRLYWSDPLNDFRHGDFKQSHIETGVLIDLLPHAYSIFQIFTSGSNLSIEDFGEDAQLEKGWIFFRDQHYGKFEFYCDKRDSTRQRRLEILSLNFNASVEFDSEIPKIKINGHSFTNHKLLHMNSTLRLELGAFLSDRLSLNIDSPNTSCIEILLNLQTGIQNKMSRLKI